MNVANREKSLARRLAVPVIVGAVSGFAATLLFLNLVDGEGARSLGRSREIAGVVGVLYLLIAIGVGVGIASPRVGARFLNVEDADELREQRLMLGYSCVAMAALSGALFVLVLAEPLGPIGGGIAAAGAIGFLLLANVLGLIQARHTDELQRAMSRDSVASAFYLLFIVGGGWALLAHCGLVGAPAPLDWLTMFAVFLLVGCFWQVARRGLLVRGPN
ncbi:hypothetical protein [Pelagerythrobacter rhizovicinus]|uniref:Uncharacterized protein n=1 Tax=Pelagerythrobacter rhizovicinus TaxID=2268576 RepID=A0A4Q2KIA5_9SPHN|nr:hypothetical protein [Pelagerythrobacter rhizovicinus]RXZ64059.1 hypothetical protein ETX26_08975 [Pelagerythrobacter rhizovicinus]